MSTKIERAEQPTDTAVFWLECKGVMSYAVAASIIQALARCTRHEEMTEIEMHIQARIQRAHNRALVREEGDE